ncbi:hypothetical protein N0V90_013329 [Kalmusia sp. IMI 367209]|nr:hypothetical protein N0V90_013329 [Kalmusia sp. IMI 367209]
MTPTQHAPVSLPRIAITYCTQCRWMLRAAYFGQELLSTFGTQIGEIALIPSTGGIFTVELTHVPPRSGTETAEAATGGGAAEAEAEHVVLWDRKAEAGFPETKVLKQRVRDRIDPERHLGHSDRDGKKAPASEKKQDEQKADVGGEEGGSKSADAACEDCADSFKPTD